jgi:hypothetical protein
MEYLHILKILKLQKNGRATAVAISQRNENLSYQDDDDDQDNTRLDEFVDFERNNMKMNKYYQDKCLPDNNSSINENSQTVIKIFLSDINEKDVISPDNLEEHIDDILDYLDYDVCQDDDVLYDDNYDDNDYL